MSEKKLFWKVSIPTYGKHGFITDISGVVQELENVDSDTEDAYLIEPVYMTDEEQQNLPDFEGF